MDATERRLADLESRVQAQQLVIDAMIEPLKIVEELMDSSSKQNERISRIYDLIGEQASFSRDHLRVTEKLIDAIEDSNTSDGKPKSAATIAGLAEIRQWISLTLQALGN